MRPLTEKETETLFNKLASYMGSSLKNLIAPLDNGPEPDRYVFRMIRDRVYYPNGEMPFLYGGNIVKAHVGRWSEDCPEHQGVIVFSMDDKPLGFGVTARSTAEARRLDPTGVVCFRQSDCGEYLRDEDTLFAG
ncbi:60S ribosome subunit biogenesis protein nip7 [Colletotrichum tanaceti]|uniref:60S ribosome subunit biogenesis protein nip7 n=1 Tax=Colletotrichum tanaceti TaxID=1306861 RepID=A0A4U6X6X4_9PEZI|nr:60S ribosome subunit biogenesis protein nip7 [Colletotrichum tanaceti]